MNTEILLHLVFFINVILIIWFKTDAFLVYARLFRLSRLFGINKFDEEYKKDFTLDYLTFLGKEYNNNFIVKLISCPVCLIVWGGIFSAIYFGNLYLCPVIILSLILYFGLSKLMD
tara:strand:+ start:4119 stop:4466 length:348 start_codon:yes stop_codon:yes gene_type:complete